MAIALLILPRTYGGGGAQRRRGSPPPLGYASPLPVRTGEDGVLVRILERLLPTHDRDPSGRPQHRRRLRAGGAPVPARPHHQRHREARAAPCDLCGAADAAGQDPVRFPHRRGRRRDPDRLRAGEPRRAGQAAEDVQAARQGGDRGARPARGAGRLAGRPTERGLTFEDPRLAALGHRTIGASAEMPDDPARAARPITSIASNSACRKAAISASDKMFALDAGLDELHAVDFERAAMSARS